MTRALVVWSLVVVACVPLPVTQGEPVDSGTLARWTVCSGSDDLALVSLESPRLHTGYTAGVGADPAKGHDPAPADPFGITNAAEGRFPNHDTDVVTFGCEGPELGRLVAMARLELKRPVPVRFFDPDDDLLTSLERGSPSIQIIANQRFEGRGRPLLVTWVLPPGWDPSKGHAIIFFSPGMLQTPNSKLIGDDVAFRSFARALARSSTDRVVLAISNVGGRTASGLQPLAEVAVVEALEYGAAHYGVDRQKVVLSGASRGGSATVSLGRRLQAFPEIRVRGISAGVFGLGHAELMGPLELAPSDLGDRAAMSVTERFTRILGWPTAALAEEHGTLSIPAAGRVTVRLTADAVTLRTTVDLRDVVLSAANIRADPDPDGWSPERLPVDFPATP